MKRIFEAVANVCILIIVGFFVGYAIALLLGVASWRHFVDYLSLLGFF